METPSLNLPKPSLNRAFDLFVSQINGNVFVGALPVASSTFDLFVSQINGNLRAPAARAIPSAFDLFVSQINGNDPLAEYQWEDFDFFRLIRKSN